MPLAKPDSAYNHSKIRRDCAAPCERRRLLVVFTKDGDFCLLDKGILFKNCEIEGQGGQSVHVVLIQSTLGEMTPLISLRFH